MFIKSIKPFWIFFGCGLLFSAGFKPAWAKTTGLGSQVEWLKEQFPEVDHFLFIDENCRECDRLVLLLSQQCSLTTLKKNLAVLAFGKEMKLKTKLWKLRQLKTQILPLSQLSAFEVQATPTLLKVFKKNKVVVDVSVGVSRILSEFKKGGLHEPLCSSK